MLIGNIPKISKADSKISQKNYYKQRAFSIFKIKSPAITLYSICQLTNFPLFSAYYFGMFTFH